MFTDKKRALEVALVLNKCMGNLTEMMTDEINRDNDDVALLDSAIKNLKVAITKIERGCGL